MPKRDPCSELSKVIAELAMNIGSRPGMRSLADVTAEMQKHIPEMTRENIVSAIVDATQGHAQARTELQKQLDALKREAKTDTNLRAAIDTLQKHIQGGTRPKAKAKKPSATPKEIQELRTKLDGLRDELKKTDPSDRAKVAARISELDRHIAAGTVPPKNLRPEAPADLAALRAERDAKYRQAQQADPAKRDELRAQIKEIQAHIDAGTFPERAAAKAPPADIAALRAERDALSKQMSKNDPRIRERLRSDIAELEGHLRAGTLPEPAVKTGEAAPDVVALRTARDNLQAALRNSEPAIRKRFEGQIDRLTARLQDGVELPPEKAPPAWQGNKDLERLAYQRDRLRAEINQAIRDAKPKSAWERVKEPLDAARAVMTSFDYSAVLRQGGILSASHPLIASRAIPDMIRAGASPEAAHRFTTEILNRPNAPLYARSKLYLSGDRASGLLPQEEKFISRIAGKIPGIAGSERAYSTFLNRLRADTFDAMVDKLGRNREVTAVEAKAIATFINEATGRGSIAGLEKAADTVNTLFFAPRYVASRFQILAGHSMWGGTWRTRKLIATEYARALAGYGVVISLLAAAGASVTFDPRSSDFGKAKIGNTHLDLLAGLAQSITLMGRLATGETKTQSGMVLPIRGEKAREGSALGLGVDFLRSKFAPVTGAVTDLLTGENVLHQPVSTGQVLARMVTPMSFGDIYQAMKEQGIPAGTAMGLLSVLGAGVNTYQTAPQGDPKDIQRGENAIQGGNFLENTVRAVKQQFPLPTDKAQRAEVVRERGKALIEAVKRLPPEQQPRPEKLREAEFGLTR